MVSTELALTPTGCPQQVQITPNNRHLSDGQHDSFARAGCEQPRSFGLLRFGEGLQRTLQVAFGVDQEGRRGDNLLARAQALDNLDMAVAAAAELHGARLKAALALRHQHDLLGAASRQTTSA